MNLNKKIIFKIAGREGVKSEPGAATLFQTCLPKRVVELK